MHGAPRCLVVAVNTRRELDVALNEAVDLLKLVGMAEQVGISVTRLSAGRYEACLNSDIPPGMTVERWGASCDERGSEGCLRCAGQQCV